jgi:hypothetical protein
MIFRCLGAPYPVLGWLFLIGNFIIAFSLPTVSSYVLISGLHEKLLRRTWRNFTGIIMSGILLVWVMTVFPNFAYYAERWNRLNKVYYVLFRIGLMPVLHSAGTSVCERMSESIKSIQREEKCLLVLPFIIISSIYRYYFQFNTTFQTSISMAVLDIVLVVSMRASKVWRGKMVDRFLWGETEERVTMLWDSELHRDRQATYIIFNMIVDYVCSIMVPIMISFNFRNQLSVNMLRSEGINNKSLFICAAVSFACCIVKDALSIYIGERTFTSFRKVVYIHFRWTAISKTLLTPVFITTLLFGLTMVLQSFAHEQFEYSSSFCDFLDECIPIVCSSTCMARTSNDSFFLPPFFNSTCHLLAEGKVSQALTQPMFQKGWFEEFKDWL